MASDATTSAGAARVDRLPPYSEEAERGVLGSVLLDGGRVIDLCLQRQLAPEAFYVPNHRLLFTALLEMNQQGQTIDPLTAANKLRGAGVLDRLGGSIALDRLIDATPTAAHAEYYIDIVRQKYLLRSVIERARTAEQLCYGSDQPADELLGLIEQSFFDISASKHELMRPWPTVIKDVIALIDLAAQKHKGIYGVPTGFNNLDATLGGMRPGTVTILASRPSMGKTSLAVNIAENVAYGVGDPDHQPRPVGIFSLEMSCEDLAMRLICARAEIATIQVWRGILSTEHFRKLVQAADHLSRAPIFIDDAAGLDVTELRSRARRMRSKNKVELIVIDYLQLLHSSAHAREGRQQEIADVSGQLKAMAKELKTPVLVLSQLSRAPETRDSKEAVPKLADLRDSGALEQDADVVLLLRRPCMITGSEDHDDKTLAIIDIAKHRTGPTKYDVHLNFIEQLTRFQDRVEGTDQPAPAQEEEGIVT